MADIKGTSGGRNPQMYRDDGDGTYSEVRSVQLYLWDNDDLAWRKVTDDDFAATGGGAGGGSSATDDAAFTIATDAGTPAMGVVTADSVDDGDVGVFAMLANRQQKVTLYDSSGVELSVGGGTQYTEDAAAAGGEKLTLAGTVRADTPASSNADGDYANMKTDSVGRLWVNASGAAVPITDNSGSITVDNGGTFAVQADTELTTGDLDTGAGTDTRAVVGLVGAKSGGGVLIPGDATAGLKVDLGADNDVTITSGTVTTITNVVHVDDNGGNISIDDGGNSITVDGTVGVSGTVTVDSELTTADLDTGGGTDTRAVVGLVGSKSGGGALIPGDATAGLKVDLGADNDVTVTSGTITTITNVVHVDDNSGSLTVDNAGTFQVIASNETASIYSGTTALTPKFASIAVSTSGDNTIVTGVSSKKLRVLNYVVVANAAVNVKWRSSTTTDKTGLLYLAANGGVSSPHSPNGLFETASGEALTLNLSGGVAVGGHLSYIEV